MRTGGSTVRSSTSSERTDDDELSHGDGDLVRSNRLAAIWSGFAGVVGALEVRFERDFLSVLEALFIMTTAATTLRFSDCN